MTGASVTIVSVKKKYIYSIVNPDPNLTLKLIKEIKIANDKMTPAFYFLFILRAHVT